MLERYWAWNYEIKDLGLWPGEGYKGHNMPVEVVKAEDAQATIADLQGQVEVAQKQLKFLGATMQPDGMVSLDLKKYHAAHRCKAHREDPWQDIDTEIDCFVCLKQRVAQLERERDDALHAAQGMSNDLTALGQKYEAELDTLQADHARVLGLVQEREYEIKRRIWAMHGSRMGHQLYGDDGRLDCNTCFRKYSDESLETVYGFEIYDANILCAKAASLPAQPTQGGE